MSHKNIRFYQTYHDEFVTSSNQATTVPENYQWLHDNKWYQWLSQLLYRITCNIGQFYCKHILQLQIINKEVLLPYQQHGYFLFGNHTQPIGDVFLPAIVCAPKRIYTIANPANLGIPVIGKLLPMLGALPIPNTTHGLRKFNLAVQQKIEEKHCVVIYPEAHVWPYCTWIRPFPASSFRFPVNCAVPAFCTTVTYQKKGTRKKPAVTVYVDGPFWPNQTLHPKEQQKQLQEQIYCCMQRRSQNSTYSYIQYEKEVNT